MISCEGQWPNNKIIQSQSLNKSRTTFLSSDKPRTKTSLIIYDIPNFDLDLDFGK